MVDVKVEVATPEVEVVAVSSCSCFVPSYSLY